MHGEDTPELTWRDGAVIGGVLLFSGTAAVLGAGAMLTAIVTLEKATSSYEHLALVFFANVSGIVALTLYFLAGGAEGAVRGHRVFEAILYWAAASSLVSIGLSLASVAVRAAFA